MRNLQIIHRRKTFHRESLLTDQESLISEVIHLENAYSSIKPKWPLVACIPQKDEIKNEKKVIIKLAEKKDLRDWRIEMPLAVNRKYTKKQFPTGQVSYFNS